MGSSSHKRKHAAVEDAGPSTSHRPSARSSSSSTIRFKVSEDNGVEGLKPLFVSTPSVSLPSEARLNLYTDGKGKGKGSSMLQGESGALEWSSSNRLKGGGVQAYEEDAVYGSSSAVQQQEEDETAAEGESYASYALALYDPSSNSVSLVQAPLHILSHVPKKLKALPSIVTDGPSSSANSFTAARAELGLSFGTKKSIRAIRAAERNKVDAGSKDLQLVQDVVMENLDEGLETLPASQQAASGQGSGSAGAGGAGGEAAQIGADEMYVALAEKQGRPKPHIHASHPQDVYSIFGEIILDKEYNAINPNALLQVTPDGVEKAVQMLPWRRSEYLNDRIKECVQAKDSPGVKEGSRRRKFKVLIWCSALMALKNNKGGVDPGNTEMMRKRFGGLNNVCNSDCLVSLLDRFAENVRGTKSRSVTSASEVRLITHLLTACLYLDTFTNTDVNLISNDLSINAKKITEFFKSLGCKIVTPRGAELERLLAAWKNEGKVSSLKDSGSKVKTASLKLPLEFPRDKKGAPKR